MDPSYDGGCLHRGRIETDIHTQFGNRTYDLSVGRVWDHVDLRPFQHLICLDLQNLEALGSRHNAGAEVCSRGFEALYSLPTVLTDLEAACN
jgi:hypothetical protein